jgi:hypothetical protein
MEWAVGQKDVREEGQMYQDNGEENRRWPSWPRKVDAAMRVKVPFRRNTSSCDPTLR